MASIGKSAGFSIGLAVVLGLVIPSSGWAQAAKAKKGAPAGALEIEEITVTAQKREENVQEIPISITAISGAALAEKGVTSLANLTEAVPNLYISTFSNTTSSLMVSMRGVSTYDIDVSVQPGVGLYVDGAYISKVIGANLDLEDLDRVEVLRGPQGTLFGRNTNGGAVNFITRKPTEERSITVQTEAGNYDAFKGRVTLNVPLIGKNGFFQSDALGTLSLRETAVYRSHDSYYRNALPPNAPPIPQPGGTSGYENMNRVFSMTSLRWQPTKDITVDYSGEYHRYSNAGVFYPTGYVYPQSPVDGGPLNLNPYVLKERADSGASNALCLPDPQHPVPNCNAPQEDSGNHRMHILTGTWDLGELGPIGHVTLKSISAYRLLTSRSAPDLDGSPQHLADTSLLEDVEHWSEELQWIGTAPRIKYVLGAYYFEERSQAWNPQWYLGGGISEYTVNKFKTKSYAPFGQFTWTPPILGDKLNVTGGIRYTQEQVHFDREFDCINISAAGMNFCNHPSFPIPGLQSFISHAGKAFGGTDAISPMGDLSYQWTDDLMTYLRVSRGFRGGTYGGRPTVAALATKPARPENVLAYEAGFKSQWFDNRLRVNANGYFSDYTDMQLSVPRASALVGLQNSLENAGKAEIWGSEVEVVAIPLNGLEASVQYGLTLPKFTEYLEQAFNLSTGLPILDQHGDPVLTNVANQRRFSITPEHTLTVGLTYTAPPTISGTFSAHLNTFWQDKITFQPNGIDLVGQGGYATVNGRLQFVGIPLDKGTLNVAVFARNLTDTWYLTSVLDFSKQLGWVGSRYGEPRTFGVQLTYNFTAS